MTIWQFQYPPGPLHPITHRRGAMDSNDRSPCGDERRRARYVRYPKDDRYGADTAGRQGAGKRRRDLRSRPRRQELPDEPAGGQGRYFQNFQWKGMVLVGWVGGAGGLKQPSISLSENSRL